MVVEYSVWCYDLVLKNTCRRLVDRQSKMEDQEANVCGTSGMDGPAEVIEALKVLCSPSTSETKVTSEQGGAHSKQDIFNLQLLGNLSKFDSHMNDRPALKNLYHRYQSDIDQMFDFFANQQADIQWRFVSSCVVGLTMTNHIIQESMKRYNQEEKKRLASLSPRDATKIQSETSAPPMPPDTLSFEQQKHISSTLQFIVSLGIMPNVCPGVGLPVECRSGFADVVDKPAGVRTVKNDLRLIVCIKGLLECLAQPSLGGIILSKYLGDLLAALCQIVFEPKRKQDQVILDSSINAVPFGDSQGPTASIQSNKSGEGVEPSQTTEAKITDHCRTKEDVPLKTEGAIITSELNSKLQLEERLSGGLSWEAKAISEKEIHREYCCEQLQSLLSRVYQPSLVRELLVLQGAPDPRVIAGLGRGMVKPAGLVRAPVWLRKACGRLLSDILVKPKGVQNIIKGMLHESEDAAVSGGLTSAATDWRKCDAVARIIAHCPRGLCVEEYYKKIAPQVLELLHIKDRTLARHFLRVTLSTIVAMVTQHRQVAEEYVICPLLLPLTNCLSDKDITMSDEPRVLLPEHELTSCIEDIHKVFVSGSDPQAAGLLLPYLLPVLHTIFALSCLTLQGVVNLRSASHQILAAFFDHADHQVALPLLQSLAFNEFPPGGGAAAAGRLHPSAALAPGGGGGAVIVCKPLSGDGVPPQPVEDLESRTLCLVQLLKKVERDNMTADFFLRLLDDLTKLIADRIEHDRASDLSTTVKKKEEKDKERAKHKLEHGEARAREEAVVDGSKVLLELEQRQIEEEKSFRRSLVVLHLLASLAEDIGPACLQSPEHILSFVQITLERGLQVLRATDDEMMGVFESETVTMAMGMLTALMGGGAELSNEDKDNMKVLLPLLEEFSQSHPDPEVQEMAKDLRIAIATCGMVWSDLLRAAEAKERSSQEVKVKEDEPGKVKLGVKEEDGSKRRHVSEEHKGRGDKPLIEVLSSQDFPAPVQKTQAAETSQDINVKPDPSHPPNAAPDTSKGNAQRLLQSLKGKSLKDSQTKKTGFQQAIDELCDPLVPVRGHGLISLRKLIQKKDPETLEQEQLLCKVFRENLDHDDTYIYLSSVEGLAALADRLHETVVPTLVSEFANFDLQCAKGQSKGKKVKRSPELRMKIGEVLVKTSRSLGDMVPKYRDVILGAMLTGARDADPLIRASSMSNLGEICRNLRFSLGNVIHEVLACVSALLKSDPETEVRKAAALFTTILLQGLGQDVTKVMDTSLRDFYRLLRHAETVEKDEMVRVHILLALEELDKNMRSVLFQPPSLTKRIRVLDAE